MLTLCVLVPSSAALVVNDLHSENCLRCYVSLTISQDLQVGFPVKRRAIERLGRCFIGYKHANLLDVRYNFCIIRNGENSSIIQCFTANMSTAKKCRKNAVITPSTVPLNTDRASPKFSCKHICLVII